MVVFLPIITSIITYYYLCYYVIIPIFMVPLSPIITVKMGSLLPIITRSIIGNNGFIITYIDLGNSVTWGCLGVKLGQRPRV